MKAFSLFSVCIGACLILFSSITPAQENGASDSETPTERADRLYETFASTAAGLDLKSQGGADVFKLQTQPLFRFTSDGDIFGSVYVWHDENQRLAVLGTIGSLPIQGVTVEFIELHLLSPKPIEPVMINGFPTKRWTPRVDDLTMHPVPDAPEVAGTPAARLLQMRSMARQFSSEMVSNGVKNQLRLLPKPLYRYANPTQQHDGALFAFVWDQGTDPEQVVRLESIEVNGKVAWYYQPLRLTYRELTLTHKGSEVWHVNEFFDRDQPLQNTPYITGLTAPIPQPQPQ